MSLRTVSELIKTTINGRVYGNFQPLHAQTEYSTVSTLGMVPQAWIVPDEGSENRWTMGRGTGGIKNMHHRVNVYVIAFMVPSLVPPLLSIRDILDGVESDMRTILMPQNLTDPVTGTVWRLLMIGESNHWISKPPMTTAAQRLTEYRGTVRVNALEAVQA